MTAAYRLYYQTGSLRPLAECLFWYDFSDFDSVTAEASDLKARHAREVAGSSVTLNSSGTTTGVSTPYPFRPVAMLAAVEILLKNPLAAPNGVWVREAHQHSWRSPDVTRPGSHLGRHQFNLKLPDGGGTNVAALVSLLRAGAGGSVIFCRPNTALFLSRDPAFAEYLAGRHSLVSIATSDWEPAYDAAWFRDHGVYVNDNMVDWQTGLNFYHCPYGGRHFLPIFHRKGGRYENLLNMAQFEAAEAGDDMCVLGRETCGCGRLKMGMSFIPHHSIKISKYDEVRRAAEAVLLPRLRSQLAYIQFIEGERGLDVLYYRVGGGDLDEGEKEAVAEALSPVPVSLRPGDFTFCGLGKVCPYMRDNGKRIRFIGTPATR